MTDIVARLRQGTGDGLRAYDWMNEAADEGERLRAECQRLAGEVSRAHRDALAWMERAAVARREGIEVAAAVASKRAASRHSTVAHCHSDRSKKHMQIRADEAGQLVADIRALLEDGR